MAPYQYEIEEVEDDITSILEDITLKLGEGREVQLVITKLEEALLWLSKVPRTNRD